jgi:hypothetical protein
VFLPTISVFLAAVAGWLAPVAIDRAAPAPHRWQQPQGATRPVATVVAGTGTVAAEHVRQVRAAVDDELPKLLPVFDDRPRHPFFVHVHESRDALPPALAGHLHPDSPAFALLGAHQLHIVWGELHRTGSKLASVVRHELVHELLDQYVAPNGRHLPRWFHEGLAQHLAGDTYLQASEEDLVVRVGTGQLRAFGDLRTQFPRDTIELRTAYGQSYSYVSWLVRTYGLGELLGVAKAADDLTRFESALAGRLGRSTLELETAWRDYVLHGSGAPWRVLFDQCFSLLLLAFLPVLVLALIRRLDAERRAARRLAATEAAMVAAAPPLPEPDPPVDEIPTPEQDAEAERYGGSPRGDDAGGGDAGDRAPR